MRQYSSKTAAPAGRARPERPNDAGAMTGSRQCERGGPSRRPRSATPIANRGWWPRLQPVRVPRRRRPSRSTTRRAAAAACSSVDPVLCQLSILAHPRERWARGPSTATNRLSGFRGSNTMRPIDTVGSSPRCCQVGPHRTSDHPDCNRSAVIHLL